MNHINSGFKAEYNEDAPALAEIRQLVGFTILEFGAPWCGHCITAEPFVKEAFKKHAALPHIKIYDGKSKPLGRAFKVKLWPTLILLRDGVEVARVVRPAHVDDVLQLLAH